jgi:phosphoribosylformylglycinamidine cyclo-ligase
VLSKYYADNFKESYNTSLDEAVVYIGEHKLSDSITLTANSSPLTTTIGKLILSPTRTYAPVLKVLLENEFDKIHGLIHCSGGGQTKCMKYLPGNFRIVKDNLFEAPEIFKLIQKSSGSNNKEMYEVFNMGCRLEIYCSPEDAEMMIATANTFNIDAQIIGRVEANDKKELVIKLKDETIVY